MEISIFKNALDILVDGKSQKEQDVVFRGYFAWPYKHIELVFMAHYPFSIMQSASCAFKMYPV